MQKRHLNARIEISERSVREQMVRIIEKANGITLMTENSRERPDLMVMDITADSETFRQKVEMFLSSKTAGEVFLVAAQPDPQMLLWAMRKGIHGVFTLPLKTEEILEALDSLKKQNSSTAGDKSRTAGQVISIVGGKGGVGATTVAVNLAVSLGRMRKKAAVALLDMNTLFGEIPLFLEIKPQYHWGDLTKNINRLDETFLMNILSQHPSGVHVLPSPGYLNGHQRPTPDIMRQLLGLMQTIFDYVIIDCGQSTNETALKTFELSTHLLVITTPSLPCLANANKLVSSVVNLGFADKQRTKIVLNRYTKRGDISVEDAQTGLGQNIFWMIPNDYITTMAAINQGRPLSMVAPKSKIARNFDELAGALAPTEAKPAKRGWRLFSR